MPPLAAILIVLHVGLSAGVYPVYPRVKVNAMRKDETGAELSDNLRLISAWYNVNPNAYVRYILQRAVDQVCTVNPLIRETLRQRP